MPTIFDDTAEADSVFALQQKTVEGFATTAATFEQQHTANGLHTDITVDSIGSRTGAVVSVDAGLLFMGGPYLVDADTEGSVISVTITADQARLAPQGIDTAMVVEIASDAARTIHGIAVAADLRQRRRFLRLVNTGNFDWTLANDSASATNTYERLFFGTGNYTVPSGTFVDLYYHPGGTIWRGPQAIVEPEPTMIIRAFTVDYDFSTGGTQNFSPGIEPTDYTQATITRCYRKDGTGFFVGGVGVADVNPFFTSNSNLRIQGPTVAIGTVTLTIEFLEDLS